MSLGANPISKLDMEGIVWEVVLIWLNDFFVFTCLFITFFTSNQSALDLMLLFTCFYQYACHEGYLWLAWNRNIYIFYFYIKAQNVWPFYMNLNLGDTLISTPYHWFTLILIHHWIIEIGSISILTISWKPHYKGIRKENYRGNSISHALFQAIVKAIF